MRASERRQRRAALAEAHPHPAAEAVEQFNARDYRACVEPLEVLWWEDRSEFIRSLIRVCVGVNQLEQGITRSPRIQLERAIAALERSGWRGRGLDASALEEPLRRALAALVEGDAEAARSILHSAAFQLRGE